MKTNQIPANFKGKSGSDQVDTLARRIAVDTPALKDLTPEQLEAVARLVMMNRWAKDLDRKAELAGIDYGGEKKTFLENAGRAKSKHTHRAYTSALAKLEAFASRKGIAVLDITPLEADDFIYDRRAMGGEAADSIRRDVAACSSFFTWLERRHVALRNPFRGTKARPKSELKKQTAYPSNDEARVIVENLRGMARLAAELVLLRGFRVGAFPKMIIEGPKNYDWANIQDTNGVRYASESKGQKIGGAVTGDMISILQNCYIGESFTPDLFKKHVKIPLFLGFTETQIADRVRYVTKQLHEKGEIAAPYSIHDFRHLFAINHYREHKDIHQLSKLLDHSGIAVTEKYLRGLGEAV